MHSVANDRPLFDRRYVEWDESLERREGRRASYVVAPALEFVLEEVQSSST